MNTNNYPLIQEKGMYPPLSETCVDTIESLCIVSKILFTREQIRTIAITQPVYLIRQELTLFRIIRGYEWATSSIYINNLDFELNSTILEEKVQMIDNHTCCNLGFYFPEILRKNCQLIVPEPIFFNSPMEDLCRSIQNFFINQNFIQCPIIGAVLFLYIIRRICIEYPDCSHVSSRWVNMINIIYDYPYYMDIPGRVNEEVLKIVNEARIQEEELKLIIDNTKKIIDRKYR